MTYLILPEGKRLSWYLAAEEVLAEEVQTPLLLTWRVSPTVIFGRHQVMANEVNIPYCQTKGIAMYRRKSGGGCVYADQNNLMLTAISPDTHSESVFATFMQTLANQLQELGLPAVHTSHNDILLGEKKVSGSACFALPTGTIVHSTLLYDVDFDTLTQAITPPAEKLAKHGVESVRQRVTGIRLLRPELTLAEVERHLRGAFTTSSRELTEIEMLRIDEKEQTYLDPLFIAGK